MEIRNSIISILKNSVSKIPSTILELGVGDGDFTEIIRSTFRRPYIIGYNLKKYKKEEIIKKLKPLIPKIRFENINKLNYTDEKEKFDIVTLGSLNNYPAYEFDFKNVDDFKNIVKSMDYYLAKDGLFFIVFLSSYTENEKQKNLITKSNFLNFEIKQIEDRSEILYSNDVVIDYCKDLFQSLGYDFEHKLVKNNDYADSTESCLEILKSYKKYGKGNFYDIPYYFDKAEAIDLKISKEGVENGYLHIIRAYKK